MTTSVEIQAAPTAAPSAARRGRVQWALAAIVVIALVVRLAIVVATPHFAPKTDALDFDRNAVALAQHGTFPQSGLAPHGGPTAFRPPLFPLALAGVYKVVGLRSSVRWSAGRVLEAVLGAVAVGLICLIALRLWGPVVGVVAGSIAAVYPPLVLVGSSLLSESLFIPLLLAAVLAALVHRDSASRWRWAALSGLLVGLAALTRGNGIVLLLPLWFLVWTDRPRRSWRSLRAPGALVAAAVLVLVPWTVRNLSVFHQLVPVTTETGGALAGTYNDLAQHRPDYPTMWIPPYVDLAPIYKQHPTANEAQVSTRLANMAFDYIKAHPGSLLKTSYWSVVRLFNLSGVGFERYAAPFEAYPRWLTELSVYAFWLLALAAIAAVFARAARAVPSALWGCPLVIIASCVVFIGATRYRSPADPFFVMLAAAGLVAGWRRWQPRLPGVRW